LDSAAENTANAANASSKGTTRWIQLESAATLAGGLEWRERWLDVRLRLFI